MTYQPKLSSAFNDTYLRSRHISPQSGMCSFCTEECEGTCEIALAAVLGAQTVYPTNTGTNQVASEKDYPIDFSHFNINGRVFGALGAVGVFSYLNKIVFGIQHFAALNRKFDIAYLNRDDLIPLTREAKDLMRGLW